MGYRGKIAERQRARELRAESWKLQGGWLRAFFDIDEERLRVALYLHEGLDLDAAIEFWSEVTGVPPERFSKPYRAAATGGIRSTKHPRGCATVRYACSRTHRQIMGLMRALFVPTNDETG